MLDTLQPDELASLTGAKRKADQIEWLRANRIPHLVGMVRICRTAGKYWTGV